MVVLNAIAVMLGTNGRKGTVSFSDDGSGTTTGGGCLSGLSPDVHALVIHTYGNIGYDWASTGPPFKLGFIDNITVDDDGNVDFKFSGKIPLSGPDSVIGRGLVLHASRSPDLGEGVAWGVIGRKPDA